MKMLGVPDDHYFVLGYPDRGLKSDPRQPHRHRPLARHEAALRAVRRRDVARRAVSLRQRDERHRARARHRAADDGHRAGGVRPASRSRRRRGASPTLALDEMHLDPHRLGYLVHAGRIATKLVRDAGARAAPAAAHAVVHLGDVPALRRTCRSRRTHCCRPTRASGPYISLLRNAFVRTNELFFVYRQQAAAAAVNQCARALCMRLAAHFSALACTQSGRQAAPASRRLRPHHPQR